MWSSDEYVSEAESDRDDEDEENEEDDLELLDDDAGFVPPSGRAADIANPRTVSHHSKSHLDSRLPSSPVPFLLCRLLFLRLHLYQLL